MCAPKKFRTIIENPRFSRELASILGDPIRADEFTDAVKMSLAIECMPKEASCIQENPPLWFIPCGANDELAIYYTFNKDEIILKSIIKTTQLI